MIFVLLFLSILPVILLGRYIYNMDFDKEPKKLLVSLFLMGIGAIVVTLLLTELLGDIIPFFLLDTESLDIISLLPYVFIGIALIEEFSKWFFVYKFGYHNYEFNHAYDGVVYAVFVSLGFACLENILYVFEGGVGTAIMRGLTAVPGHACFGVLMGFYLGMAKTCDKHKNDHLSKMNKIKSLLYPILAHGIYDYLIFASEHSAIFFLLFVLFVLFFFTQVPKKVQQLASVRYDISDRSQMPIVNYSLNNGYQYRFCPICGESVRGNFCTRCGHNHMRY